MTRLPARFIEDRALRDAARAVIEEDIARIRDGASDVLEQAKQQASDHRGVLALLVGAILLWLMRVPLLALLLGEDSDDTTHDDNGDADGEEAHPEAEAPGVPEGELQ